MKPIKIRKYATPEQQTLMAADVGIQYPNQGSDYSGCGGPSVWFGTPDSQGYCGFLLMYEHWDTTITVTGQIPQDLRNQMYRMCATLRTLDDLVQDMEQDLVSLFDVGRLVEALLNTEKEAMDVDPS